jgi:hypothetical protein
MAFGVENTSPGAQNMTIHTWSSVTNAVTTHQNYNYHERYAWLRITDDGTNLKFYASAHGKMYSTQVLSVARSINSSGVPTLVGFGIDNTNGVGVSGMLLSWRTF